MSKTTDVIDKANTIPEPPKELSNTDIVIQQDLAPLCGLMGEQENILDFVDNVSKQVGVTFCSVM